MTFNLVAAIEAEEQDTPADSLQRAVKMGELMVAADTEVKRLETELKDAKARYNAIAMDQLPLLLTELGLTSIELTDGAKIQVTTGLSCSITEANHEQAMRWLIDHDFSGLIKTNVTVSFAAAEQSEAVELAATLSKEHDGVIYKATVHPATLKSFVKEQLAAGADLPLDLFSVHEYSIAKLTQPRSK